MCELPSESDATEQPDRELEAQYVQGYLEIPEDAAESEALLPHLPLESFPWD